MSNKVLIKRSSVQGKNPATTDLALGELALNTYDGNLFFKKSPGGTDAVVTVSTNGNLLAYTRVTSNTTAVSRQSYIADTSGGTFTITLPASPSTGDWVIIADGANFNTTALTVGRNSQTIEGIAEDLSLNISGVSVTLVYDGSTWEVFTQVGAQGGTEVTLGGVQTLTNKTLTTPTISSPSITGTVASLTIAGAASVTANSATDKYINIGTHGQLFDDGNIHIHSNSGALWLNTLDGSDINLGLQSNSGTSNVKASGIFSMNSGYGSIAPVFGVRAWISCGYIGTTMVTNGSGNLSVTRTAAGKYSFTFGTAMPDGNYSVTATCKTPVDNSDVAANLAYNIATTTTGFTIHCARYGTGFVDVPQLCVQVVR